MNIASVNPTIEGNFWASAVFSAFFPFFQMHTMAVKPMGVAYVPQGNTEILDTKNMATRAVGVFPLGVFENLMSPRWLLDPAIDPHNTSVLFMGSMRFDVPTSPVCSDNDNDNVGLYKMLANTPLDYNVLNRQTGGDETYLKELNRAMATVGSNACGNRAVWGPALDTFISNLRKRFRDIQILKVIEHPITRNLWTLQPHGVLKEISRRGVSLELNDTHCIPTCARICPSTCEWAPNCTSQCKPCTFMANNESLDWRLQCEPCVTAMMGRRRMLAEQGAIISLTVSDDCAHLFVDATQTPHDDGTVTLELLTNMPQQTMRMVSPLILQCRRVLLRPHMVLRTSAATTRLSGWAMWAGLLLGFLLL
jgi:hypothetical protein